MINTIGFLPSCSKVDKLIQFVPDDGVKKHLEYLQIPIATPHQSDEDATDPEDRVTIKDTDSIIFCTSNTEEMSSVGFYGYDDVEMFFHHDFFVFSTILDSCHVANTHVAVATFEPSIMIYDFLVEFPVLPQHLLVGHSGPVTGIKNKFDKLMSCSEDRTVIEWDPNEMRLKTQKNHDVAIERFDFEGSSLVLGANTYLNINNENISLDYQIEQLRLRDNLVYVSDEEGNLLIYDVRMPANAMIQHKVHDQSVTDFCLANDWIVTTSLDNTVKMWKIEDSLLRLKSEVTAVQGSAVLSLGFNPFNSFDEVFAGDEKDGLYPIRLGEDAKADNIQ